MVVEAWLQRAAASAPAATALQTPAGSCSYVELLARARGGAAELHARGVRPGQRVAIALPAGLEFAYALHACLLLGAAVVPVDLRLRTGERRAIEDCAALVLAEPLPGVSLPGEPPRGRPTAAVGLDVPVTGALVGAEADGGCDGAPAPAPAGAVHDLDAVAAVIHTSGTTSAPKP